MCIECISIVCEDTGDAHAAGILEYHTPCSYTLAYMCFLLSVGTQKARGSGTEAPGASWRASGRASRDKFKGGDSWRADTANRRASDKDVTTDRRTQKRIEQRARRSSYR
jgi:hypothetical protein